MTPKHRSLHCALALACLGAAAEVRADPPAQAQPNAAEHAPSPAQKPAVDSLRVARKAAWHAIMRELRVPSELPQPVRAELKLHARRLAKLVRIRSLAVAAHDQAVIQRVDQAFIREAVRHRAQLTRLWPAPPPPSKPRAAPKDDDDEDRPSGESQGEDEGEEG